MYEKDDMIEIKNEKELKDLFAMKELGEIAEVLIKKDRPEHWKNELGDLCGLCIKPMLELAQMDFDLACSIGIDRKLQKISKNKNVETKSKDLNSLEF